MIEQYAYSNVDLAGGRTESVVCRITETNKYMSRQWIYWEWFTTSGDIGRERDIVLYVWKQQLAYLDYAMRRDPEFVAGELLNENRHLNL